jgi:hypothetical protein
MGDLAFRDLIEGMREQTDIVQVIGQRVALDRHNKAICPFHREKTPSFSVNPRLRKHLMEECNFPLDLCLRAGVLVWLAGHEVLSWYLIDRLSIIFDRGDV